jgi:hypothetical protein
MRGRRLEGEESGQGREMTQTCHKSA